MADLGPHCLECVRLRVEVERLRLLFDDIAYRAEHGTDADVSRETLLYLARRALTEDPPRG